ncbi:glycine cleavage system aminomethyltransferase GcvT [Anaerovorax odorimutans]|uniref:Glycine cleavage system aminomethyltransferase GcvT n=1 Tax=Anaerovorax odorimutans TaxID=109327 RepID=A0ABT1RR06_9FIRM|nr:glycine cleavage system aminomethyltransferase GcvT [Anaerovorax odorimutans]MCQ4637615.1 glycine cleavage system aminomethyltransferase GcvT [Anaerovorax odorimutans]
MAELKQTQLHQAHVDAGAKMVDFGGWEMPMQYPTGIIAEHLYTRHGCSIFDVSHMGRLIIRGPERVGFLQHVMTGNVQALKLNQAQYSIIPNEQGGAIDDAYVYRFEEDYFSVVVNAANTDTVWEHFSEKIKDFDAVMENVTPLWAAIAVQGPESKNILQRIVGSVQLTEPMRNELNTLTVPSLDNMVMRIAKTGYTGEPIGYEVYVKSEYARKLWDRLIEEGARPAGLGARDTTRLEAGMPLHGHELGQDEEGKEIPIFAIPLAKFAVSFAEQKGAYIGRGQLEKQQQAFLRIHNRDFSDCAALPRRIMPITLLGRGVMRAGCPVLKDGKKVGYVSSGTMVPYYVSEGKGLSTKITEQINRRSIGFCYIDSTILTDERVQVDIRGKMVDAVIPEFHMKNDAPPYTRVILYRQKEDEPAEKTIPGQDAAYKLIGDTLSNHIWRQEECINLIPSEMSASKAVRMLEIADPSFRYAEHRKVASFYDEEIFYYQGTEFIGRVEELLMEEMKRYLGCREVETRVISGQMSNTCVFSALVDFKNRLNRKREPRRLGYVLNNHIIKGGHLSAQPMGALKDYIAVDPVTERKAVVNFPVCAEDPYRIDVEETKKIIDEYKPELIIFGKSMVIYREPVKEISQFVREMGYDTNIMYDMAHVLGLIGDHFQKPFEDGADLVTGSTHKTFFGPQRGIIGGNWKETDLKYELWETIQSRAFPGSTSNHHLGTQLALLMAVYEMNAYKDKYQKNVIASAKSFAQSLNREGLRVEGDPALGFTQTHQVIVNVGYGTGPEVAQRLEDNNLICNYQATPVEEGFTASGALRLGVAEMTRFGFTEKEFDELAGLMAACILKGKNVKDEVIKLRSKFTDMKYCFDDSRMSKALEDLGVRLGL